MAHPECPPEVVQQADAALSTSGMLRYVRQSKRREFIIGTEVGILYPLQQANPDKRFFPASEKMVCTDMKKITPADVLACLEGMQGRVVVPEEIRRQALAAVQRMIALVK